MLRMRLAPARTRRRRALAAGKSPRCASFFNATLIVRRGKSPAKDAWAPPFGFDLACGFVCTEGCGDVHAHERINVHKLASLDDFLSARTDLSAYVVDLASCHAHCWHSQEWFC
mmetsp:Transcript_96006/g.241944  ORF Transcript_96006/g.241944 Transcript_96006/m.241944 type:complete len:114 (-) Transcript_96006:21-362(-)